MNRYRRRRLAARQATTLLYLLVIWSFTACKPPEPPGRTGRHLPTGTLIAAIGAHQSHPNWKGIRGGAERYCKGRPNIAFFSAAPGETSPAAQRATIESVLAKHPDAVCIQTTHETTAEAIDLLRAGTTALVTIGRELDDVRIDGHVAADLVQGAGLLGDRLASLLPPARNEYGTERVERSYALLHADGRTELDSRCYDRFRAAARNAPFLHLLGEGQVGRSVATARAAALSLLSEYPSVELLVTLDPALWLAVPNRMELSEGNRFATLSAVPRLWPRLAGGEAIALVGALDGEIGYAAAEVAVARLMQIPDALTEREIPCELVRREDLSGFIRRYAVAANLDPRDLTPFPATAPAADSP